MEQNLQNYNEQDNEIEIDIMDLISALWHKAPVIILSGVLLALLAVVGTKLFISPTYQSTTRLYVLAKQNNDTLTNSDLQTSTLLTNDYAELINSRTVTEAVIAQMGLDLTHEDLLGKMEVTVPSDTRILTISVEDEDPYVARDLAVAIRDVASEHIQQVMDVEAVNVADEANIPESPVSPNTMMYGLIAGILGCFIAVLVVLIQYLTNDTIKNSEDVERYLQLSMLGMIPLDDQEKKNSKRDIRKSMKRA